MTIYTDAFNLATLKFHKMFPKLSLIFLVIHFLCSIDAYAIAPTPTSSPSGRKDTSVENSVTMRKSQYDYASSHSVTMRNSIPGSGLDRRQILSGGGKILFTSLFPLKTTRVLALGRKEAPDSWAVHRGDFGQPFLESLLGNTTSSGLIFKDVNKGSGKPAKEGDQAKVHIVGYVFETGEKYMNSYVGIPQFEYLQRVGARPDQKIMKGLSEGLIGMRKHGKRILVVPAYLAYQYLTIMSNDNKSEIVPGGASLVLYVEMLDF